MTDDRLTISPVLVRQLLRTQFPMWADLPVQRVERDGWDNTTFRLGDTLKVRLPTAARYAAQVEKEHRWLPILAKVLPLPIPEPLALGVPTAAYPYPWSVYRWIAGDPVSAGGTTDLTRLAADLACFLVKLQSCSTEDGPGAGVHNFFRGGSLRVYDAETRECLALLRDEISVKAAEAVWEEALASSWNGPPVWVHGDVAAGNLLVAQGRLSAVIDFGSCAVGDPACDLVAAWTIFRGDSRAVFQSAVGWDAACWKRARGWALWKALITIAAQKRSDQLMDAPACQVIADVIEG